MNTTTGTGGSGALDLWMLPPRPLFFLLRAASSLRSTAGAARLYHRPHKREAAAARLVVTHSTHLEGLLPTLRRVIAALPPPKLATVVPGRIAVCRGT